MKLKRTDGYMLLLFVVCYLLKCLAFEAPSIVTKYYTLSFYPIVQILQQKVLSWCAWPLSYVLILGYIFLSLTLLLRNVSKWTKHEGLFTILRYLLYSIILVYVSFQCLWGFNYARNPISRELHMHEETISKVDLEQALSTVQDTLLLIRNQLDTNLLYRNHQGADIQALVPMAEQALAQNGLATIKGLQFKVLSPEGILLHWSTAGIYFPFTGECNIDGGLHPIQVPFTLAHELAHGHGWGDEATCNFLAWLSLHDSDNQYFRYSAWFDYWRELLSNYRKNYPENYKTIYQNIDAKLLTDLKDIRKKMDLFEDWFPNLRNKIYDNYLKSQGVGEGIKSYNAMIKLVFAYQRRGLLNR